MIYLCRIAKLFELQVLHMELGTAGGALTLCDNCAFVVYSGRCHHYTFFIPQGLEYFYW